MPNECIKGETVKMGTDNREYRHSKQQQIQRNGVCFHYLSIMRSHRTVKFLAELKAAFASGCLFLCLCVCVCACVCVSVKKWRIQWKLRWQREVTFGSRVDMKRAGLN